MCTLNIIITLATCLVTSPSLSPSNSWDRHDCPSLVGFCSYTIGFSSNNIIGEACLLGAVC